MTEISHSQFLDRFLRTAQDTDGGFWYQCIDLAKLYVQEVYWITLGSFGWSARSGWFNKSKTFDKKWKRIEFKPGLVPEQGDVIFYDVGMNGHVAIVDSANKIDITVIEQNWATWTGDWKGYNAINLETKRDYKNVYGWYHLIK